MTNFRLGSLAALAILFSIFVLQNTETIIVQFLIFEFSLSIALLMVIAFGIGLTLGVGGAFYRRLRRKIVS